MKGLIYILTLCLLLGCKSTKQATKTNDRLTTNATLNLQTENSELASVSFDWSKIDWSKINENIRIKEYGAPDSTGQQPILRDIDINRQTESASDEKLLADEKSGSNSKAIDKSKIEADYKSAASDTTVTKSTTPAWVNFAVLGVVFGVFVLVALILKRFGIIKW